MYKTQKLINKFLNKVEYPIQQSVCMLFVKIMIDMIAKLQDGYIKNKKKKQCNACES